MEYALASTHVYMCTYTHAHTSCEHVHTSVQLAVWSIKYWGSDSDPGNPFMKIILAEQIHPFPDWIKTLVAKVRPCSFVFQEAKESNGRVSSICMSEYVLRWTGVKRNSF